MRGSIIVIDGGEGTGTTTMSKYMVEMINKHGGKAEWSREPGGSPFAEKIRELILSPDAKGADAETMFGLFWAARRAHFVETVRPWIREGVTVVLDRCDSSTWAYQIRGQQQDQLRELFYKMREHYLKDIAPDRYIILDASPEVGVARAKGRGGVLTHFDERDTQFHQRVREGFLEFASMRAGNVINAELPEPAVKAHILDFVEPLIK